VPWNGFLPSYLCLVRTAFCSFSSSGTSPVKTSGNRRRFPNGIASFSASTPHAYARLSEEIERLLDQGYATPAERRVLDEMYANYKAHGWNGDMDARLEKVYTLRTDHPAEN